MDGALCFGNREDWLKSNHNKTLSVWLILFKKGSGKSGLTLQEAVEEAIRYGWIDGKLRRLDEERFKLRFTPRKTSSVWSKINRERAERLIASGLMAPPGLLAVEEAKKSGEWDKAYTNAVRDELPDDLKEALRMNSAAWDNFCGFANTYRNIYISWVMKLKLLKRGREESKKWLNNRSKTKSKHFCKPPYYGSHANFCKNIVALLHAHFNHKGLRVKPNCFSMKVAGSPLSPLEPFFGGEKVLLLELFCRGLDSFLRWLEA